MLDTITHNGLDYAITHNGGDIVLEGIGHDNTIVIECALVKLMHESCKSSIINGIWVHFTYADHLHYVLTHEREEIESRLKNNEYQLLTQ